MPKIARVLALIIGFILFLFSPFDALAADNLLSNGDFETWEGTLPTNWLKNYSTLQTSSVSGNVHSGSGAVLLQSSSNSTKYLYQILQITPNVTYRLSGWGKISSGGGKLYLRATQCPNSECPSASDIKISDSPYMTSLAWSNLTLDFVAAENAQFVKIKASLYPPDSSETFAVWDDLSFEVLDAPPPETQEDIPDPQVEWDTISSGVIGDVFKLTFSLRNFDRSIDYFIKMLGGQTQSGSDFLSINDSWARFPKVSTDNTGNVSGEIYGRIKPENDPGDYQIGLRFHHGVNGDNTDSGLKTVNFAVPTVSPTTSPVLGVASSSPQISVVDPTFSTQSPEPNIILGTTSANFFFQSPATPSAKKIAKKSEIPWAPIVFLSAGFLSLSAAAIFLLKNRFRV